METTGNKILITGGSTGIGLAIAELFVKAGNEVIICGRRESKLQEAKLKIPELHIYWKKANQASLNRTIIT